MTLLRSLLLLAVLAPALDAQPVIPEPAVTSGGARTAGEIPRGTELVADLVGWVALGRVLGSSGYDQVAQSPRQWPQDGRSYGRRFVTRSAQLATIETVRHGLAAALQRDPAYVRCQCSGRGTRVGHAALAVVTDFDVSGRRRVGWPRFAGALAGALVLGQLQPGQGTAETVAIRTVTTVATSGIGNVLKEFSLYPGSRRKD